jgi:hypothetical protein
MPEKEQYIEKPKPPTIAALEITLQKCLQAINHPKEHKTLEFYNPIVLDLTTFVIPRVRKAPQDIKYEVRNMILGFMAENHNKIPFSVESQFLEIIDLTKETTSF